MTTQHLPIDEWLALVGRQQSASAFDDETYERFYKLGVAPVNAVLAARLEAGELEGPSEAEITAATATLVEALVRDQLSQHVGDAVHFQDSLDRIFRDGFKGFAQMSTQELLLAASDSGIARRLPNVIDTLRAAVVDRLTDVRKTVIQFTVLHDDGKDLADRSLGDIVTECDDGGYVGGDLKVVSSAALTQDQLDTSAEALGSEADFFLRTEF